MCLNTGDTCETPHSVISGHLGYAREFAAYGRYRPPLSLAICAAAVKYITTAWVRTPGRSTLVKPEGGFRVKLPSGKRLHNYGKSQFFMGKSPFFMGKSPFLMGKSTISMAIFNSYVTNYQRVYTCIYCICAAHVRRCKRVHENHLIMVIMW